MRAKQLLPRIASIEVCEISSNWFILKGLGCNQYNDQWLGDFDSAEDAALIHIELEKQIEQSASKSLTAAEAAYIINSKRTQLNDRLRAA